MTSYGLPYIGSKNRLAEKIVCHLHEADALVDVFFGGGAGKRRHMTQKLYIVK